MGGGGESDVTYKQSHEQKKLYDKSYDVLKNIWQTARGGGNLWDIPQSMFPTGDWWQNLSPDIRAGINAPIMDMANQMGEQFGGAGMMGSPMTGPSGAFGGALGEAVGRTWGPQSAMTGWNMMQPGNQAQLQANMAPWNLMPSYLGAGNQMTPQPVVSQNQGSPLGGMMGGAAGGGMMGLMAGMGAEGGLAAASPWLIPAFAGMGALGGIFGG